MKFKAIRKLTLVAAVAAISTVICGISASAFVEGYENATELTSSVTASITRDVCSMLITGLRPVILSTSGRSILPRKLRA